MGRKKLKFRLSIFNRNMAMSEQQLISLLEEIKSKKLGID